MRLPTFNYAIPFGLANLTAVPSVPVRTTAEHGNTSVACEQTKMFDMTWEFKAFSRYLLRLVMIVNLQFYDRIPRDNVSRKSAHVWNSHPIQYSTVPSPVLVSYCAARKKIMNGKMIFISSRDTNIEHKTYTI